MLLQAQGADYAPVLFTLPYLQARKDVEGSLFLQKRSSAPVYQFTILNKKSQCEMPLFAHMATFAFFCMRHPVHKDVLQNHRVLSNMDTLQQTQIASTMANLVVPMSACR